MKKFSNFSFLRFSCEETGFRVFFTRKFLHTRIPLPVFSSHENCVSRFFFTRKCRCLFFLHTRIPLPVFSSHGNCVSRFFFTRKCRCLFFLHTRIPLPVSSHENPVTRFSTASHLRVLGGFGRLAGERPPNRRLLSRRAGTCGSLFSQSRVDRASSSNRRYSGIGHA